MTNEPGPPSVDAGLVRVRLDLTYDGTDFAGWALQPGQRTVQGVVEEALRTILRVPTATLTTAGRTDAGVHATGQVAHVDMPAPLWAEFSPSLLRRLAGVLTSDVRVRSIRGVSFDFDARFSAQWRRYVYRATDAAFGVEPLRRHDTLAWSRPLDTDAMAAAALGLLGVHNFAAYCRRREGATTIRCLERLEVVRSGELIEWHVQADAFCYSMVRSLVGALLSVGDGRRPVDWPVALLEQSIRAHQVTVAAARGLTLVEVGYPPDEELAARARLTRQRRDGRVLPPLGRPRFAP
jgi:tRNA pseudouridine38-40 synthase